MIDLAVATVIGERCAVKAEECGKVVAVSVCVAVVDMASVVSKTILVWS